MYILHTTCMLLLISVSTISASDMTRIKKWHHVNKFAGKAVAYTGKGCYGNNTNGFTTQSGNQALLHFAVINKEIKRWETGEKGYEMITIKKSNQHSDVIAIIDSQLEHSVLGLRLLTPKEKTVLKDAIRKQEAFLHDGSRKLPLSRLDD